jgi:hypothetical protein
MNRELLKEIVEDCERLEELVFKQRRSICELKKVVAEYEHKTVYMVTTEDIHSKVLRWICTHRSTRKCIRLTIKGQMQLKNPHQILIIIYKLNRELFNKLIDTAIDEVEDVKKTPETIAQQVVTDITCNSSNLII